MKKQSKPIKPDALQTRSLTWRITARPLPVGNALLPQGCSDCGCLGPARQQPLLTIDKRD